MLYQYLTVPFMRRPNARWTAFHTEHINSSFSSSEKTTKTQKGTNYNSRCCSSILVKKKVTLLVNLVKKHEKLLKKMPLYIPYSIIIEWHDVQGLVPLFDLTFVSDCERFFHLTSTPYKRYYLLLPCSNVNNYFSLTLFEIFNWCSLPYCH